jgi:hypothetical protein
MGTKSTSGIILIGGLCFAVLMSACASRHVIKADSTPATKAQYDIAGDQLLDVGVITFDPGIPEEEKELEEKNIFPEVRKAEARYIPYNIKTTLEDTGYWGAVRALPADTGTMDVVVKGKIAFSNGEKLILSITVQDATGREWLNKEYTDTASKYAYRKRSQEYEDPFQDLYNAVANDMLAVRNQLSSKEIRNIRTVSELRFAAELSPHAFGNHLQTSEAGRYSIKRLPAEDDPMLERVRKIRERDYSLVDILDGHYANFHRDMEQAYNEWRKNSYEETVALQKVKVSARNRMLLGAAAILAGIFGASQSASSVGRTAGTVAILGGAAVVKSGIDKYGESKIHTEALQELGDSFEAEVSPQVVQVEDRTITLTGSAEAQYAEWRRLLREIYATETGFAPTDQPLPDTSRVQ